MAVRIKGRPRKHAEFDDFLAALPEPMTKRPRYLKGIGIFRGKREDTAWLKVSLLHGGEYNGRVHSKGSSVEIKVGRLNSWTWEQLVAKHADLQGRADRGEPLEETPPISFADCASKWLERAKQRVLNFETEEINVRVHLNPFFGSKQVTSISVGDVNTWITRQLKAFKPGTVKRHLNTLKAIFNDALRTGELQRNPCDSADRIRGTSAKQRFLEAEEIIRLFAAAQKVEAWLYDAIVWALHSGMRRGEIQALRWSDIRSLPDGGRIAVLESSKSGKPRSVICTQGMIEVLENQTDRRVEGDDRVFPVGAMTWRRRWEKARTEADLGDIDFHDLRRTNATQAAASGVDLRTLAARIGHTDLAMLEKHYAMVVGSAEHEAAEKIQTTFDSLTGNVVAISHPRKK
jgi:integrase